MRTYARAEPVFVAGEGALLFDEQGREYLDFLGGIAVSALGHGDEGLARILFEQASMLVHTSNLFRHRFAEDLAKRLCALCGMGAAFFANSGAEAIECAMKLARKAQRDRGREERTGFAALAGGFHGRTLGALSLTHAEKYRAPFGPLMQASFVEPEDSAALERVLVERRPAALFVEPIQGEGGVRELSASFLRDARELCTETGTLLVHDEIQCGCGRTGRFLAGQHHGIAPDVVTLAKPLAAGLPMGACLCSEELAETLGPGDHGSTFGGGPLACRAALYFLDRLDGGLLEEVDRKGRILRAGLEDLASRHVAIAEVRGRGLMAGIRLARGAQAVQKALFERGLIANRTAGDVIRLLPPYVVREEQIGEALLRIDRTLTTLEEGP